MSDYSKGTIYLVKFRNDPSLVYIGSTIRLLNERLDEYKNDNTAILYKFINDNFYGNWDDCYIELYEYYPCINKEELDKRKGEIIRKFKNDSNYNCINQIINGRTNQEYRQENKKKITCDCGCIISKGHMKRHLDSISHTISLINKDS